jgi:putative membrane protein
MPVRLVGSGYGTMSAVTRRQPRWVYDEGDEPDPRFTLANERTFLAWVRTALAMFAGGLALHALNVPKTAWVRTLLVVALIALGAVVCVFSLLRWARVERAMRLREPLPAFTLGVVMTSALVLIGVLLLIVLI